MPRSKAWQHHRSVSPEHALQPRHSGLLSTREPVRRGLEDDEACGNTHYLLTRTSRPRTDLEKLGEATIVTKSRSGQTFCSRNRRRRTWTAVGS
ncbi:hypothetical protein [Exiguobacterium aurantiacum]|uniref:hypothetical protein n=1 Tax=Exiguobacterium aurantiacum TaxID=33987 RepID=UPI0011C03C31|nr:hypothetical protein [Exiguobacterium aurantiacum]